MPEAFESWLNSNRSVEAESELISWWKASERVWPSNATVTGGTALTNMNKICFANDNWSGLAWFSGGFEEIGIYRNRSGALESLWRRLSDMRIDPWDVTQQETQATTTAPIRKPEASIVLELQQPVLIDKPSRETFSRAVKTIRPIFEKFRETKYEPYCTPVSPQGIQFREKSYCEKWPKSSGIQNWATTFEARLTE